MSMDRTDPGFTNHVTFPYQGRDPVCDGCDRDHEPEEYSFMQFRNADEVRHYIGASRRREWRKLSNDRKSATAWSSEPPAK